VNRCKYCQADLAPDAPVSAVVEREDFAALLGDIKKLSDAKAALRIEQHPLPRDPGVALDLAQHLLKLSRSTAQRHELQGAAAQNVAAALRDQLAGILAEMNPSERKRYQSFDLAWRRSAGEERFYMGLGLSLFVLLPLGVIGLLILLFRG
jgi:hypothetical protein